MSVELLIGEKRIPVGDLLICPVKGVPLDRKNSPREIKCTRGEGNNTKIYNAYVDSRVTDEEVG
jgi:hypothetical protein